MMLKIRKKKRNKIKLFVCILNLRVVRNCGWLFFVLYNYFICNFSLPYVYCCFNKQYLDDKRIIKKLMIF